MKTLRVVLYCALGGAGTLLAGFGTGHNVWSWLAGVVLTAAFVPIAIFGARSFLGQFFVIWPALVVITGVCTWSEAVIFVPGAGQRAARDLAGVLVVWSLVSLWFALVARSLGLTGDDDIPIPRPSWLRAVVAVAICGAVYLVCYTVFGGITYAFFTRKYYPQAAQVAQGLGLSFWGIEFLRGMLMTLSVVPAIYSLRMKRWQVAVVIGLLIWIAGGLAPLLAPNSIMSTTQRMIHIVEIFTQNLPLGVAAGLLLRPKSKSLM